MELCDNVGGCDKFSFVDDGSVCALYGDTGNTNSNEVGTICGAKEFVGPHASYTDTTTVEVNKTICNSTTGGELYADLDITETKMLSTTFLECVSMCNNDVHCSAFEHYGTTCKFFTGVVESAAYDGDDAHHKCYLKDEELLGEFVKHEDFGCGNNLLDTEIPAPHNEYSCYLICHERNDCVGFEYVTESDSCFAYGSVTLGAFTGRDCYERGSGLNNNIGYHTGRLIFPEAEYTAGVHDLANFSEYMEGLLDVVLGKTTDVSAVVDETYGLVVDFVIEDDHSFALSHESALFLAGKIVETSDPYDLGLQVLGATNPAPITNGPTTSPSASPSASPTTGTPTTSPTKAPTFAASEIVHSFKVHEEKVCGVSWDLEFNETDVFKCMEHCDNIVECTHATYNSTDGLCHTFVEGHVALDDADAELACLEKTYVSPLTAYDVTEDVRCSRESYIYPIHLHTVMLEVTEHEHCAAICNAYHDCEGYNYIGGDRCDFFSQSDTEDVAAGTDCYKKNMDVVDAFIGHENSACGNDVVGTHEDVDLGWHSCHNHCESDYHCSGYEFYATPKTCIYYGSVSLTLATGKTCYERTFATDPIIGKHVGRLHWTDATWSAVVHESLAFKQYIEGVVEGILGTNITILETYEGSVVVEYVVEDGSPALGAQDLQLIKDQIAEDGTYALGVHLLGGTNPPPPTAAPTNAPTDSTAAPTNAPTTGTPTAAPTDEPPTDAPTMPPTNPPTAVIDGLFGEHHTIEIVSFVLIGMAGVVFLYVGLRFTYIWWTNSYNQL